MQYKGYEITKSGTYYTVIVSYSEHWFAKSVATAKMLVDSEIIPRKRRASK